MTTRMPAVSDPPSVERRCPRRPEVSAASAAEHRPRGPSDESDPGLWRGLLIGIALSFFGLWGPLGPVGGGGSSEAATRPLP